MEGDRARRLTTRAVAACLGLAAVCLLVGVALLLAGDHPSAPLALPAAQLTRGIAGGDAAAWLSLGALVLLAAPAVRVAGMLVVFQRERQVGALVAGVVLLLLLLAALAGALLGAAPEAGR